MDAVASLIGDWDSWVTNREIRLKAIISPSGHERGLRSVSKELLHAYHYDYKRGSW